MGVHVFPPSSVRKAPAAEMAMNIRPGSLGSRRMVCRHSPPAPGAQALYRAGHTAEALAALMVSQARQDPELDDAVRKLREAVGLEDRH